MSDSTSSNYPIHIDLTTIPSYEHSYPTQGFEKHLNIFLSWFVIVIGHVHTHLFLWQHYKTKQKWDKNPLKVNWHNMMHILQIAIYKEDIEKVRFVLNSLLKQSTEINQVGQHFFIALCLEERDYGCIERYQPLIDEYRTEFYKMIMIVHPDNAILGEVRGKCSNMNWAVRQIMRDYITELSQFECVISPVDADIIFPSHYFNSLVQDYYSRSDDPAIRARFIYRPHIFQTTSATSQEMHYFARVVGAMHSCINSILSILRTCMSLYHVSLPLAINVGFWDADMVPEDTHMAQKCFFYSTYQPTLHWSPLAVSTSLASVLTSSIQTIKILHRQSVRWAYNLLEMGYVFHSLFFNKRSDSGRPIITWYRRLVGFYTFLMNIFFLSFITTIANVGILCSLYLFISHHQPYMNIWFKAMGIVTIPYVCLGYYGAFLDYLFFPHYLEDLVVPHKEKWWVTILHVIFWSPLTILFTALTVQIAYIEANIRCSFTKLEHDSTAAELERQGKKKETSYEVSSILDEKRPILH